MNILETVKEILEQGKDRITPDEAEFVMSTLRSFLSIHPDYVPHTARKKVADEDEIKLWTLIQPILDRAQGIDRAQGMG